MHPLVQQIILIVITAAPIITMVLLHAKNQKP